MREQAILEKISIHKGGGSIKRHLSLFINIILFLIKIEILEIPRNPICAPPMVGDK